MRLSSSLCIFCLVIHGGRDHLVQCPSMRLASPYQSAPKWAKIGTVMPSLRNNGFNPHDLFCFSSSQHSLVGMLNGQFLCVLNHPWGAGSRQSLALKNVQCVQVCSITAHVSSLPLGPLPPPPPLLLVLHLCSWCGCLPQKLLNTQRHHFKFHAYMCLCNLSCRSHQPTSVARWLLQNTIFSLLCPTLKESYSASVSSSLSSVLHGHMSLDAYVIGPSVPLCTLIGGS